MDEMKLVLLHLRLRWLTSLFSFQLRPHRELLVSSSSRWHSLMCLRFYSHSLCLLHLPLCLRQDGSKRVRMLNMQKVSSPLDLKSGSVS